MPSFVYQLLSLTTIVILSFAQLDNLDLTAEHVAQSLMAPVASLDGSGGPAIAIGTSGEADVSSTSSDANIAETAQADVDRPAANSCPKGKIRRRGDRSFCSSTDAPTSSQQAPQNGDEQRSNGEARQQRQQDSPEDWQIFAPILGNNCPDGYLAVCAAPNLIEDPPGTYTRIPWIAHNVPAIISIEEYSRLWLPWDLCKTMDGEELFMCCKRTWPRYPGSEMWDATPDRATFLNRYYLIAYECTPQEMPADLP